MRILRGSGGLSRSAGLGVGRGREGKPGLPFRLAFPFRVPEHLRFFLWAGLAFQCLSGFLFSSLVPGQDSGRRM